MGSSKSFMSGAVYVRSLAEIDRQAMGKDEGYKPHKDEDSLAESDRQAIDKDKGYKPHKDEDSLAEIDDRQAMDKDKGYKPHKDEDWRKDDGYRWSGGEQLYGTFVGAAPPVADGRQRYVWEQERSSSSSQGWSPGPGDSTTAVRSGGFDNILRECEEAQQGRSSQSQQFEEAISQNIYKKLLLSQSQQWLAADSPDEPEIIHPVGSEDKQIGTVDESDEADKAVSTDNASPAKKDT